MLAVLDLHVLAAVVTFLLAVALVARALQGRSRGGAVVVALLGGAAAMTLTLWIHQDLRGEREDDGPYPVRVGERIPPPGPSEPASDAAPIRMAVWSDCRNSIQVQNRLVAALRERKPDLTVGLGDLVGMARTYQFQLLADRLAEAGTPVFFVPGNHDLDPFGTLKPYARVFGTPCWSFVHRGVLFLGLDTSRGLDDPLDRAWLEAEIERRRGAVKRVLLFTHHPLYPPPNRPKKALVEDQGTWALRFHAESEGMTVLAGNFHGYDVQRRGRVLQVVTGGAGSRLEEGPYHFAWVEVGDEVKVEQVVLAQPDEVSEAAERLIVFREEGAYAAGEFPVRVLLTAVGFAVFLGGLVGAMCRRRSPHSSSARSA